LEWHSYFPIWKKRIITNERATTNGQSQQVPSFLLCIVLPLGRFLSSISRLIQKADTFHSSMHTHRAGQKSETAKYLRFAANSSNSGGTTHLGVTEDGAGSVLFFLISTHSPVRGLCQFS